MNLPGDGSKIAGSSNHPSPAEPGCVVSYLGSLMTEANVETLLAEKLIGSSPKNAAAADAGKIRRAFAIPLS